MSKRAEEAALKANYPKCCDNKRHCGLKKCPSMCVKCGPFMQGYEQAEKDTIERAAAWLKDYVKYFELYDEKGVEEFKKAMEEE